MSPAAGAPAWSVSACLWVCAGGAAGSGARYLLASAVAAAGGPENRVLPLLGTFAVNALGSFLLGLLLQWEAVLASPSIRLLLCTGALGGFTTYSTFNEETLALLREGRLGLAAANVAATLLCCLAAGAAGALCGRALGP